MVEPEILHEIIPELGPEALKEATPTALVVITPSVLKVGRLVIEEAKVIDASVKMARLGLRLASQPRIVRLLKARLIGEVLHVLLASELPETSSQFPVAIGVNGDA